MPTDTQTETTSTASTAGTAGTTSVEGGPGAGTQDRRRWDVEIETTTAPMNAGDPVEVTATLTNLRGDFASSELTLSVGGDRAEIRGVSLAGGVSETVTLTWETGSGDAGEYTAVVTAGQESDAEPIEVRGTDDAIFEVEIQSTTPPEETANESLVVTATVTNTGTSRDTQDVRLAVGGVERDRETLALDAGASRTVSFSWELREVGETTVEVASEDDDATVSVAPGGDGGDLLADTLPARVAPAPPRTRRCRILLPPPAATPPRAGSVTSDLASSRGIRPVGPRGSGRGHDDSQPSVARAVWSWESYSWGPLLERGNWWLQSGYTGAEAVIGRDTEVDEQRAP